jgi:hypothetical protein
VNEPISVPIYPDVMLLEADAILRKAVTYGNICRALVEINEAPSFLQAGENFLNAAREFAKQLKVMKELAAHQSDYEREVRHAGVLLRKELAAAVAENDAAGRVAE